MTPTVTSTVTSGAPHILQGEEEQWKLHIRATSSLDAEAGEHLLLIRDALLSRTTFHAVIISKMGTQQLPPEEMPC